MLAFRQEQHTSSADHSHASATRHRPSLPFIDEKPGISGLCEHDRFGFAAIEELGELCHVSGFGNIVGRELTLFLCLRQGKRARPGGFDLKLLEHRLWDEYLLEESTEYLDVAGNRESVERASVRNDEVWRHPPASTSASSSSGG